MPRRFALLDVFAGRPLEGNPLAVVLDAEGLDDAAMQRIAREFNLSETVFLVPSANKAHSTGMRIFTPTRELTFAGHPTVGTAVFLALQRFGGAAARDIIEVLEVPAGPVRAVVELTGPRSGLAILDVPVKPVETGVAPEREHIAEALSLIPAEIGFENHAPTAFAAGGRFVLVPVRDLEAMGRAAPRSGSFERVFADSGAYLYTRDAGAITRQFRARMFARHLGMTEDPATGSAAVALVGALGRFDGFTAGTHRYVIEQGIEMGRPSLVMLEVDSENGGIHAIRLGGEAVLTARGEMEIDAAAS